MKCNNYTEFINREQYCGSLTNYNIVNKDSTCIYEILVSQTVKSLNFKKILIEIWMET